MGRENDWITPLIINDKKTARRFVRAMERSERMSRRRKARERIAQWFGGKK